MGFDDPLDEGEPDFRPPLPPDDRLWRHPSEVAGGAAAAVDTVGGGGGRRRDPRMWVVALVSGLVGALLATGLTIAAGGLDGDDGAVEVVEREAPPLEGVDLTGVTAIAERVTPAIVQIQVSTPAGESSGSGVIFRDDGLVLTNHHVTEGSSSVTVVLSDGRKEKGRVVGADADTDIAVVRIEHGPYPTATLGSATTLKAGEPCIAIGSPLGLAGGPSVSVGVVSALGRALDGDDGIRLYDMIQTDAAISPGSSGGALLDRRGAVIGVTTAIAVSEAGAEGLAFATPIDIARSVAEDLITTGRAAHVWLGIEGADLTQADADRLDVDGGAIVKRVVAGSPAAEVGLRAGDVIVQVGDRDVRTMAALVVALRAREVGDAVALRYLRDGTAGSVDVKLEERPR